MVRAYLNARGLNPCDGGWEMAQRLSGLSKSWRTICLEWCRDVSTVPLQAKSKWDEAANAERCAWSAGVMMALKRTAPSLTSLELIAFDGSALSGLDRISNPLRKLAFSGCGNVGQTLVDIAHRLESLTALELRECRDVSSDGFAALAEGSCAKLASLDLSGGGEEDDSIARGVLRYARALAFSEPGTAKPLGQRLPLESDGYDGPHQGGQFGASAASPP